MRVRKGNSPVCSCPIIANYFFELRKYRIIFGANDFAAVTDMIGNNGLQSFHDGCRAHLRDEVALVVAHAAEGAGVGAVDAAFGDGDPSLGESGIEVTAEISIFPPRMPQDQGARAQVAEGARAQPAVQR